MWLLYVVFYIASLVLLIIAVGAHSPRTTLSTFELKRRVARGEHAARDIHEREQQLGYVRSLQAAAVGLLFAVSTILGIVAFGWVYGTLLAVVVAVELPRTAHTPLVQRKIQALYDKVEPSLLRLPTQAPWLFTVIGKRQLNTADRQIGSREELQQLVAEAGEVLTKNEQGAIQAALTSADHLVCDYMSPRANLTAVAKEELLGPLVLDDLHKTGHTYIPVIAGDLDHIVGILHMQDVRNLEVKRSLTAGKAMRSPAYYIQEDQPLGQVVAAFLQTHSNLLIVVNERGETTGVLSLRTVLAALLGRAIDDSSEDYDTPHARTVRTGAGKKTTS